MPICSLILPPVSVSCTVSFLFVLSGARFFRTFTPFLLPHNSFSFLPFTSFFPLFSAPSVTFTLPSLLAFQLSIRDRFTQLTFLSLLEPLDFRPFGFSPFFSLLMSTFLLLIAFPLIFPIPLSALQNTLLPSQLFSSDYRRFGHHLSLFYLWCNPSPIVRCYAFIIRMAASMPTAYLSPTSHSLPHSDGVWDLIVLSGLSPS